jgi:Interferon-induced transmembrane protein
MKCPSCGAEIADNSAKCEFCEQATSSAGEISAQDKIPSLSSQLMQEPPQQPTGVMSSPPPEVPSENPYANYSTASSSRPSHAAGSVPNHLVWAIVSTLCCCWPMGIVAIVYAAQVDSKLAGGDYEGAVASSNNAKLWSWISFGGAALLGILYIMLMAFGFALEA